MVVNNYFPRIAVVPLLCGLIIGLLFGKWWFWASSSLNPDLTPEPKITCLVISRGNYLNRINAAKSTWLKKCDNHLIVKFSRTRGNNPIQQSGPDYVVSADSGWGALCQSFHLLPQPIQWLIIVPESVIVVVENLRKFVKKKDWKSAVYMGHPVRHFLGEFNTLSAGILISNASLSALLHRFPDGRLCESGGKYWNNEDVYLGSQLRKLGIYYQDSRDDKGRGRFHGFNVNTLLSPGRIFRQTDYYKKAIYPTQEGFDCCSNELITLDTSDADHALIQYFLMYGINSKQDSCDAPPTVLPIKEPEWVTALREIGYTGPTANMSSEEYYAIWAKHMPPEVLAEKMAKVVNGS